LQNKKTAEGKKKEKKKYILQGTNNPSSAFRRSSSRYYYLYNGNRPLEKKKNKLFLFSIQFFFNSYNFFKFFKIQGEESCALDLRARPGSSIPTSL